MGQADMTVQKGIVARLGAQGDGIIDGPEGDIFVPYALPGDAVTFDADGGVTAIAPGPAERVQAPCLHFGVCGGCVSQHMGPKLYEDWKIEGLKAAFRARGLTPEIAQLEAMPLGSRRRVTLTSAPGRGGPVVGYHQRKSHDLVDISTCSVMTPRLERALAPLKALLGLLPDALWAARVFVADVEGGLDVDIVPEADAKALDAPRRERLAHAAQAMGIIRLTIGRELVMTSQEPQLASGRAKIPLPRAGFFQASALAEQQMIAAVVAILKGKKFKRAVDLFSGLGPFTLALAEHGTVKAVDSDQPALAALMRAARATPGLKPIETLRRDLFRDPLGLLELSAFDAAVLDPPRAGAEAQVKMLAKSKLAKIAYVSCNPATLARDARTLVDGGYRLTRVVPIDQFVHSAHLEAVAEFAR
ncbi:MAG: hypothetical protein RL291_1291 [Pseudomonadota bacterium]